MIIINLCRLLLFTILTLVTIITLFTIFSILTVIYLKSSTLPLAVCGVRGISSVV